MTTTIALFNNKGGVGKTTLAYHLAHMFSRLGVTVLAADLDPQSNLTSMFLDESELEELWDEQSGLIAQGVASAASPGHSPRVTDVRTIADAVRPILEGLGDIEPIQPAQIDSGLWLLPGSIELSQFEDHLSRAWPQSFAGEPAAIRTTTAFYRTVTRASEYAGADVVIIDVGPNLGAINRAALLGADHVLVPLAADLFSLKGLSNLGPVLRRWRRDWQDVVAPRIPADIAAPRGIMEPLGYVIMQPEMRLDRPVKAYARWLERIPWVFSTAVLDADPSKERSHEIATMRNYRSLMPLAHDARKPMFDLRAADGALGSTQTYVKTCFQEFRSLAERVLSLAGVSVS
ncbi:ParA family protein [Myceligenerans xiligouense]|uniref:AAA domain-containing protein n=1 Tax=Myceligenerans xiligouense TaxID=253184 RepID=A0A3N4YQZ2_9MICO|nr:ParA family protein [Myceligenerans xiligouense]RPF20910.1 AAA domain-containing protein [Myceligenerans xiligouense]